jgi:hypothetical protein
MRNLYILTFLFLSLSSIGQTKDKARQQILEMLKRNNPDAHYFITELYRMPTKFKSGNMTISTSPPSDFMIYSQRYKPMDILSDISTVVHESCHMYQSQKTNVILVEKGIQLDFDIDYTVYFIDQHEEYLVKHSRTFPSVKMAGEIPKTLQSFRYGTYIKTNQSSLGTQQNGVYGIMEEWSAYYNGFKTTVLNYPEYASMSKNGDMDGYFNFLSDAGSIRMAYPEFKYYTLQYLEYARRKEKAIYDQVLANEDFKIAFQAIDKAYADMMEQFQKRKEAIKELAKSKGLDFRESEEYTMIGNKGVGSFNKEYVGYELALSEDKFSVILAELSH